ncbi:MAG: hypothetical protein FWH37_10015 [Candidatus Bathyarchaeota archaeon]|nr:hypothetical protein [Candidatus Termiticorpusculum sp.]
MDWQSSIIAAKILTHFICDYVTVHNFVQLNRTLGEYNMISSERNIVEYVFIKPSGTNINIAFEGDYYEF